MTDDELLDTLRKLAPYREAETGHGIILTADNAKAHVEIDKLVWSFLRSQGFTKSCNYLEIVSDEFWYE